MTTSVALVTDEVVIAKVPVKPPVGTVTVAGTLATAGLLLDRETTVVSGAETLTITVPLDESPPATVAGLTSRFVSEVGSGAGRGRTLRVAENAPGVPAVLTPRTRQNRFVDGRPPARYADDVTVCVRTSGAVKLLESSIWIVYDAAPVTSLQSKPTGCGGVRAVGRRHQRRCGRDRRRCRRRVASGEGQLRDERVAPEDRRIAVPDRVERADGRREVHRERAAGDVEVARRVAPDVAAPSACEPPRNVAYGRAEPVALSSAMTASPTPLKVRVGGVRRDREVRGRRACGEPGVTGRVEHDAADRVARAPSDRGRVHQRRAGRR